MSSENLCPDLEVLFTELEEGHGPALDHARDCPLCSGVLEEHRLLERELSRMSDPLPPPDLVMKVMARVATEPPPLRHELAAGLPILIVTLIAGLALLFTSDAALSSAGTGLAALLSNLRAFLEGLTSGVRALWSTAALPAAAVLTSFLLASLYALKRLAGSPTPSLSEA